MIDFNQGNRKLSDCVSVNELIFTEVEGFV